MAVSWLVFDGAKGQIRMISVLATPARGRWVDQCLCALVSCCKVALCAIEETCQTGAHEGPSIATSDNSRGLPRLPEKPQTPSRRKTGRPVQPSPSRRASALCTACAHNWAASAPHRSNKYAPRRPAVAPIARQQSSAPKAPEPGAA